MKIVNSSNNVKNVINKKNVNIYVCGPTVYNHVHVGNIRPIVTFDVLHRYLKYKNFNVNFVHNITDIDDKILSRAKEEQVNELELSNFYNEQYNIILNELNILEVKKPKVSENMNEIINFIIELYDKGFAYKLDDGIYFDISKISSSYGEVSNMNIGSLEDGKRISINDNKLNSNDFALWKIKDEGITWNSPFGKGRPGWHTECVVLIDKFFNDSVDIHGGGIDLRFPHHENENAQFVALRKKPLAETWMHVGHLMIDNEKMSKSLGNFLIAKDIINEWGSNAVRWFFYQAKYSKPLNYTNDFINLAKNDITKIIGEMNKAKSYLIINDKFIEEKKISDEIDNLFSDDLNLPNIVTIVQTETKKISNLIRTSNWNELLDLYNNIYTTLELLGIKINDIFTPNVINSLKEWDQLVKEKNFEKADEIRNKLFAKKII